MNWIEIIGGLIAIDIAASYLLLKYQKKHNLIFYNMINHNIIKYEGFAWVYLEDHGTVVTPLPEKIKRYEILEDKVRFFLYDGGIEESYWSESEVSMMRFKRVDFWNC